MTLSSRSATTRQLKNSFAQWLITIGGISVLFTLVLIFLYLLYVIKPIFDSAEIDSIVSIPANSSSKVLATGIDELKEVSYQINSNGEIDFYQLVASNQHPVGSNILSQSLIAQDNQLTQVLNVDNNAKILLDERGNLQFIRAKFNASYPNDVRVITPEVIYPLGDSAIIIDEQQQKLNNVAFAMNEERAVFVAFTEDHRLIKTTLIAEDDFNYDPGYEMLYQEIDFTQQQVDDILISPNLMLAFVLTNNHIEVFELDDDSLVPLKTVIPAKLKTNKITAMALLSGGSSILIGDSAGVVSQWFEINSPAGRVFTEIRSFKVSDNEAISKIVAEQFRKSFFTLTPSGQLSVLYATSEANLWQGKIAPSLPDSFTVSPRADGIIISNNNKLELFSVNNEHPEVTWHALWQEVWYEGYPEPEYMWQSTSGSDDFEAKFSLVPISFGTIKAALYAMMFAVPIALAAAIYTAYFMTSGLRTKVKPTVELMEALPTVILGFLAGLWLAPLFEKYLPAIFLLFFLLPMTVVVTAFIWHRLPQNIKLKVPETWAPLLLIPMLLLAGYCAFMLSPLIETHFFGGDMRQYLTNTLGIDFDQRNALVVGIAMGFAVIPTIFSMAEDAIFSVPKHLTSGSLALGATPWQTLTKVVLLTASPGIFSAIMMGLGRAVGETMIVLMATGNTPILDWNIFEGMRTLSANIAVEMPESEVGSSHYRILFLAAFVLFVFTFIFNTLAEFIRQRLREKYSSL